jgi:hypothetical protein
VQECQLIFGLETILASQVTDNRPVLLFDVRLIVFSIGPGTREADLFGLAITEERVIDKLTAIIRIQTQ